MAHLHSHFPRQVELIPSVNDFHQGKGRHHQRLPEALLSGTEASHALLSADSNTLQCQLGSCKIFKAFCSRGNGCAKGNKKKCGAFRVLCFSSLEILVFSQLYSPLYAQVTQHRCAIAMATTKSNLTVGLVGQMTTFELRQEVEKRGLLGEVQNINHDTLLRRLVQVRQKATKIHQPSDRTAAGHCALLWQIGDVCSITCVGWEDTFLSHRCVR